MPGPMVTDRIKRVERQRFQYFCKCNACDFRPGDDVSAHARLERIQSRSAGE